MSALCLIVGSPLNWAWIACTRSIYLSPILAGINSCGGMGSGFPDDQVRDNHDFPGDSRAGGILDARKEIFTRPAADLVLILFNGRQRHIQILRRRHIVISDQGDNLRGCG